MENTITNVLNLYCFENIWNEPLSEFRNNVVPYKLKERSVKGTIDVGSESIELPTNDNYFVYIVNSNTVHAFDIKYLTYNWLTTSQLVNEYNVLIYTYTLSGLMFPKGEVYIRKLRNNQYYLIAVNKRLSSKICTSQEMNNLRMTFYLDSDYTNKITARTFDIVNDSNYITRRQVIDYLSSLGLNKTPQLTTYINGESVRITSEGSIPDNSVVDIVNDENKLFTFDVDLTDISNHNVYHSEEDNIYKQLVHIPKELNPSNNVYTHNTMEIHVHRKDIVSGTVLNGRYLHRCDIHATTQVTHNDISIPLYVLDAFRDDLETQDVVLRISVRQHDKDNILINDSSYIDLLYLQDDKKIIDCLMGRVRVDLDFWEARNLEKSKYVKTMFDVPSAYDRQDVSYYLDILGYYHTINVIYNKILYSKVADAIGDRLLFPKPLIYQDRDMFPAVYHNGIKILDKYVSFENTTGQISVGIDPLVVLKPEDEIVAELFLDGRKNVYSVEVTPTNTQIDIPYSNFDVYICEDSEQVKSSIKTYSESFVKLDSFIGNIIITDVQDTKLKRVTFGPNLYNKKVVIENRDRVYRLSIDSDIDNNMILGKPLQFTLLNDLTPGAEAYPIFHQPFVQVFLNRKYLVNNVDYVIVEVKNSSDELMAHEIIIQNYQYLKSSGNILEIHVTAAQLDNEIEGFVVDNYAYEEDKLALLFSNISTVYSDGVLDYYAVNHGNYIEMSNSRQGAIFQVKTVLPDGLKDVLGDYYENLDINRLTILDNYFNGVRPSLPEKIILEDSHKLFSNYLVTLIYKLLNDPEYTNINLDPDISKTLEKFKDINYLRDIDLCITNQDKLMFINNYPHYKNLEVSDPNLYKMINAIIKYVLPEDLYNEGY